MQLSLLWNQALLGEPSRHSLEAGGTQQVH